MAVKWFPKPLIRTNAIIHGFYHKYLKKSFFFCFWNHCYFLWIWLQSLTIYKTSIIYFQCYAIYYRFCPQSICGVIKLFPFSLHSRRIINLSPVMLISEEQPAQPALPVQPEGTRVVCGHCGNTFLVSNQTFVIVASLCKCRSWSHTFDHCSWSYSFIQLQISQKIKRKPF